MNREPRSREMRARLKRAAERGNKPARYALATDAEVKRLKKENEQMRATLEKIAAADPFTAPCVDARATLAALKPQVTRERKRR